MQSTFKFSLIFYRIILAQILNYIRKIIIPYTFNYSTRIIACNYKSRNTNHQETSDLNKNILIPLLCNFLLHHISDCFKRVFRNELDIEGIKMAGQTELFRELPRRSKRKGEGSQMVRNIKSREIHLSNEIFINENCERGKRPVYALVWEICIIYGRFLRRGEITMVISRSWISGNTRKSGRREGRLFSRRTMSEMKSSADLGWFNVSR